MTLHFKNSFSITDSLSERMHQPILAKVVNILDGTIFVAFPANQDIYKIDRSVSALPELQLGDDVIVQYVDDLLILMHRLMRSDEGHWPIQMDAKGNLTIKAGQTISLRTAKSTIHIDSEGNIQLKGKELLSEAESTNRIVGGLITIN